MKFHTNRNWMLLRLLHLCAMVSYFLFIYLNVSSCLLRCSASVHELIRVVFIMNALFSWKIRQQYFIMHPVNKSSIEFAFLPFFSRSRFLAAAQNCQRFMRNVKTRMCRHIWAKEEHTRTRSIERVRYIVFFPFECAQCVSANTQTETRTQIRRAKRAICECDLCECKRNGNSRVTTGQASAITDIRTHAHTRCSRLKHLNAY